MLFKARRGVAGWKAQAAAADPTAFKTFCYVYWVSKACVDLNASDRLHAALFLEDKAPSIRDKNVNANANAQGQPSSKP